MNPSLSLHAFTGKCRALNDATLVLSFSCESHPSLPSEDTTLGSPDDEQGIDLG